MIYVDPREGSKDLEHPLRLLNLDVTMETLRSGDVCFTSLHGPGGSDVRIGLEYKQLSDLLSCITSGRLAGGQLPKMQEDYDVTILLLEGIWRSTADGVIEQKSRWGWQPVRVAGRYYMMRDLDQYLLTLTLQGGMRIWRVGTQQESARYIAALYRWWQKPWEDHASLQTFNLSGPPRVTLVPPSLVRRVAKELPGIGWERSSAVEDAFPSVAQMCYADEADWGRIAGIGKTLRRRIVNAIHGFSS